MIETKPTDDKSFIINKITEPALNYGGLIWLMTYIQNDVFALILHKLHYIMRTFEILSSFLNKEEYTFDLGVCRLSCHWKCFDCIKLGLTNSDKRLVLDLEQTKQFM